MYYVDIICYSTTLSSPLPTSIQSDSPSAFPSPLSCALSFPFPFPLPFPLALPLPRALDPRARPLFPFRCQGGTLVPSPDPPFPDPASEKVSCTIESLPPSPLSLPSPSTPPLLSRFKSLTRILSSKL